MTESEKLECVIAAVKLKQGELSSTGYELYTVVEVEKYVLSE